MFHGAMAHNEKQGIFVRLYRMCGEIIVRHVDREKKIKQSYTFKLNQYEEAKQKYNKLIETLPNDGETDFSVEKIK